MQPDEILEFMRDNAKTIKAFAFKLGYQNHQLMYQVADGKGSRAARVRLSIMMDKRPSSVWPKNSPMVKVLDDYEYDNQRQQEPAHAA